MANKPAPFNQDIYDSLVSKRDALASDLGSSPTAYAPDTDPTSTDLYNQTSLDALNKQVKVMNGQKLSEQWYGPKQSEDTTAGQGQSENMLMSGLNHLSTPLYAVAGAAEWATGTGSSKDITKNINENIQQREGFGNILSREGLPYGVSMPLGFALDVALDPINWVTAGTSALIPRIGTGLVKGGLEGAKVGLQSRAIPLGIKTADALSLGRLSSAVKGADILTAAKAAGETAPAQGKITANLANFVKTAAAKGAQANSDYESLIGRNMVKTAGNGEVAANLVKSGDKGWTMPGDQKVAVGDYINSAVQMLPGGDKLVDAFKYSPSDWFKNRVIAQQIINSADEFKNKTGVSFIPQLQSIKKDVKAGGGITLPDFIPGGGSSDFFDQAVHDPNTSNVGKVFANTISSGVKLMENPDPVLSMTGGGSDGIMQTILQDHGFAASLDDIAKARSFLTEDKTGIEAFDKLSEYLRSVTVGKQGNRWTLAAGKRNAEGVLENPELDKSIKPIAELMKAYKGYIEMFKVSKIGLSPTSWINAVLGNSIMAEMAGISIANPDMMRSMRQAAGFAMSSAENQPEIIHRLFQNSPQMRAWANKNPIAFAGILNFDLDKVFNTMGSLNDMVEVAAKEAQVGKYGFITNLDEETKFKQDLMELIDKVNPGFMNAASYEEKAAVAAGVAPVGLAQNELSKSGNWFSDWRKSLAEKARDPHASRGVKVLDAMYNKAMEKYGSTDQMWRLGTLLHVTENGVTEEELKKIARQFGMTPEDIADTYSHAVTGEKMYKIMPEKAMQLASEIYMNYSAMPAAVKVLRSMPILGAPLASFTYGMSVKTGKAAMYNPALFNKVNYLMSEVSGDKSPLEKQALKQPYYQFYNQPGMMKVPIPFFEDNPMYANLQNLLPYYSLNMFTPSERKYQATLPGDVLNFLDKFPILQDPVGQLMFDYFIQPMILQKGEIAQSSFGSPLYPIDATGLQKAGYATRSLVEGVTPGVAGFAGFPAGLMTDANNYNWVPSYGFRRAAQGIQGNTPLGIPAKESASSRSIRAFMSMMGLQIHPLNTSFTSSQVKSTLKSTNQ